MGWADVGRETTRQAGSSDLVKLEQGTKRLRLLPQTAKEGPISWWQYSIRTPGGDFRSWVAPPPEQDFFDPVRGLFQLTRRHAGLVFDYQENRVLILEAGNQIWEELKKYVEAGIDLSTRDIGITRTGEGRNTQYSVIYYDPTPFDVSKLDPSTFPDLQSRYRPPTYEQVLNDLRELGFPKPEQLFQLRQLTYEEAWATTINFGKYRGKTIGHVYNAEPDYILFLAGKSNNAEVREAARVVANTLMGTAYEVRGVAPKLEDVEYVKPQRGDAPPAQPATGQQHEEQPTPPPPAVQPQPQPQQQEVAPPAPQPQQPAQPTPPPPPNAGDEAERQQLIESINKVFETNPKYTDFMEIIKAMQAATAPNPKTSIHEFTIEELKRLYEIITK